MILKCTPHISISVLIGVLLLLSSCQQRYWFRIKLRNEYKRTHSIRIDVNNYSPQFLGPEFVQYMRDASKKQLKKEGYIISPKDTPAFRFVLSMYVDSFNATILTNNKPGFITNNPNSFSLTNPNVYKFRNSVKAILFECQLMPYKNPIPNWSERNDLYFFNDYERDIGRSVGMVRYLIRSGARNHK